jgi:NADH dehydrogenase/NADH:ubiquinone oxidoreductase subunit G
MFTIKIDDKEISVSEETTIIQAVEQAEIYIPHFAHILISLRSIS